MAVALDIPQTVSPVDALWTLFQGQTKKVKKEFISRIMDLVNTESNVHNSISPTLAKKIAKAREEYNNGETISCLSPEDMQRYFDSL